MADNHQLDDLFRRTFDQLPDSPAPNGWDQPSDRVWQGVQQQVSTGSALTSSGTLLIAALGGLVVIGALAFYLLGGFSLRETHEGPVTPPLPREAVPVPQVSEPTAAPMETPVVQEPTQETAPAKSTKKQPVNTVQKQHQGSSDPSTDTRTAPPVKNSLERRKIENTNGGQ
jgi:hypothetical protein